MRDRDTRVATTTGCSGSTRRDRSECWPSAPRARCRAWADSLPENRLHGVIAGKLYTYASDARNRGWPNGIEITGKRNTGMTNTPVSDALGRIGYAKRIDDPVSATTAAELATARVDRDDLQSVLRLSGRPWPSGMPVFSCPSADKRPATTRCSMN